MSAPPARRFCGSCWQPRFLDRALRRVEEYPANAPHDGLNPVTAGLVKGAQKKPLTAWTTREPALPAASVFST
jgi:hypothetical protein